MEEYMKKRFLVFILVIIALLITGCSNSGMRFKKDYESLNGKTNANNKAYRVITIDKNNPSKKYYIPACVNEWKKGICNNKYFCVGRKI